MVAGGKNMKSKMWKSTFREIKQSFGRFMAIFAITALGVSLFSGLKVLQPAMINLVFSAVFLRLANIAAVKNIQTLEH